jgi:glucokinase
MTSLAGGAEKITCQHMEKAYEQGDPLAVRALNQMVSYLGLWFFNLYVTFNINCFVLGGGLLNLGDKLLGPVRQIFDEYNSQGTMSPDLPVYFKTAELGGQVGIVGAAELIFSEFLSE